MSSEEAVNFLEKKRDKSVNLLVVNYGPWDLGDRTSHHQLACDWTEVDS